MPEPYYLIDASVYIFRSYFGLPENWYSQNSGHGLSQESHIGQESYPTQAVYGYLNFLLTLLEAESPNYIAAAFDESLGTCFRNTIYPEYKANRVLPDAALAFQLNACVEVTRLLGVASFASETYEADDIVGTLAKVGRESDHKIIVITGDKDLSQLIVSDIETLLKAGERIADLPIRGAKQLPVKIKSYREQILMSQKLTVIAEDVPMVGFENLGIQKSGSIGGNSALMRKSIDMDKLSLFCESMGLPDRFLIRADKISVPQQGCTE